MSIRYRAADGTETIVSGLTPGGDIEAGAVATREGIFTVSSIAAYDTAQGTITFDTPMPDDDYLLEVCNITSGNSWRFMILTVENKTATGFHWSACRPVGSSGSAMTVAQTVKYIATKTYSVQHAAQNAEDIANILSVIPSNATSENKLATQSDLKNVEIDVDDTLSTLSTNPVQNKVVKTAIDTKQDKAFIGTTAEWEALSLSEKNKYELVNITDDSETGETVDAVIDGDMRPVTSNAVYDVTNSIKERLVVSIPANTYATYGEACAALKIIYDGLSDAEKRNSYILARDSSIYDNTALNGFFVRPNFSSSKNAAYFYSIYLPTCVLIDWSIVGTAGVSFNDVTSHAQEAKIDLYVRAH